MGFDTNGVSLLIKAKEIGVNFDKVITIGRQRLHLTEKELTELLIKAGLLNKKNSFIKKVKDINFYSEPFLNLLGASVIKSVDISDYEGANIIHDMNEPMDPTDEKYSLVIDSGSLEHIFNFPIAIKNCMKLVKENGYFIGISPTNNFFGHGFYQFSPELYFRIFNPDNGFEIVKMYFFIDNKKATIYELFDPFDLRQRSTMTNSSPSYICVIAKKIKEKVIFDKTPQQSDYENILWNNGKVGTNIKNNGKPFTPEWIKKLIPLPVKNLLYYLIKKIRTLIKYKRRIMIDPLIKSIKIHTSPTGSMNNKFFKK